MRLTLTTSATCTVSTVLMLLLVGQAAHAGQCRRIFTTIVGTAFPCAESPGGLCSDGDIRRGILKGTKFAVYTNSGPSAGLPATEPPEVLSYNAEATFTTRRGELHLNQLGVSDPFRQVYTELNRVVGGTGRFEGASGDLFISGNLYDEGSRFDGLVTGTLCLQRPIKTD